MVYIIVLGLIVLALITGFIGSSEATIGIEINTLNSPYYKIGIFYHRYTMDDGSVEDELTIGLFFVNLVVVFWKPND